VSESAIGSILSEPPRGAGCLLPGMIYSASMAEAVNLESIPARLAAIREHIALLDDYLDPESLEAEVERLEGEMQKPGFWDDQESAADVSAEHSRTQRKLKMFEALQTEAGDLGEMAEMAETDEEMAAELDEQLISIEGRLAELEEARLFSGTYDSGDAIVTVHAGAGGTDSQDWAEILLRMYLRWAERRGFSVEMKEASEGDEAGLKSATFMLKGENAYGLIAAERGVHRLVRISPFDSSSRRHTSFAQVDVAPTVDETVDVEIDEGDLRIDTYRASGAGGQHVNKTDSAVRITHEPTGVVVQCQNERSQTQNKAVAMQMLRSKLIELEERKRAEAVSQERGEVKDVAWGSQIRSYVLHPYTMVKDHRTEFEVGDAQRVLDGDIDGFIREYLNRTA
jgi:peptide chain release factor 2